MYVDNNLFNFEALIRIKTNTFISRLTVSGITIINVSSLTIGLKERKYGIIGTTFYTELYCIMRPYTEG